MPRHQDRHRLVGVRWVSIAVVVAVAQQMPVLVLVLVDVWILDAYVFLGTCEPHSGIANVSTVALRTSAQWHCERQHSGIANVRCSVLNSNIAPLISKWRKI